MNDIKLRPALYSEKAAIWDILAAAIERRKADGSQQWQDGYPNEEVVANDLKENYGYVLETNGKVAGYCALILNNEPAYAAIDGRWLTNGSYVVIHRIAISPDYIGKGLVQVMLQQIETLVKYDEIPSIRVDTNYDNAPMLHILEKMGYRYCGEVRTRGGLRKAYEKVIL